jgi:hypothetical protein
MKGFGSKTLHTKLSNCLLACPRRSALACVSTESRRQKRTGSPIRSQMQAKCPAVPDTRKAYVITSPGALSRLLPRAEPLPPLQQGKVCTLVCNQRDVDTCGSIHVVPNEAGASATHETSGHDWHTPTHKRIHTHIHIHTHVRIHTHTHIHAQAQTQHTHMLTHTQSCLRLHLFDMMYAYNVRTH